MRWRVGRPHGSRLEVDFQVHEVATIRDFGEIDDAPLRAGEYPPHIGHRRVDADAEMARHLARLEAFVFRGPIGTPVRTSFGAMHERPAAFVRAEDEDGAFGWGEALCNFPSCAAEHRARAAVRRTGADRAGHRRRRPRPLGSRAARRAGEPLWRLLGGTSDRIAVYASGINPERPQDTVAAQFATGHRAFRLKVGFGEARDVENARVVRALIGSGACLMLDANQAWSLEEARRIAPELEAFDIGWLDEPLRADQPFAEWQVLRRATRIPLAAGET
jgi:D-galactarolactone cycloisomerase